MAGAGGGCGCSRVRRGDGVGAGEAGHGAQILTVPGPLCAWELGLAEEPGVQVLLQVLHVLQVLLHGASA